MPPKPDFSQFLRERKVTMMHQRGAIAADETNQRTEMAKAEEEAIEKIQTQLFVEQRKLLISAETAMRKTIKQEADTICANLFTERQHHGAVARLLKAENRIRKSILEEEQQFFTQLSERAISSHQETTVMVEHAKMRQKLRIIQQQIEKITKLGVTGCEQNTEVFISFLKRAYSIIADLYADDIIKTLRQLEQKSDAQYTDVMNFLSLVADSLQKLRSPSSTLFDYFHLQLLVINLRCILNDTLSAESKIKKGVISLSSIKELLSQGIFNYYLPPKFFFTPEQRLENIAMFDCVNALIKIYDKLTCVRLSLSKAKYERFPELITGNLPYSKVANLLSMFFANAYPINPSFYFELNQLVEQGKQNAAFYPQLKNDQTKELESLEILINNSLDDIWEGVTSERKRRAELAALSSDHATLGSNSAELFAEQKQLLIDAEATMRQNLLLIQSKIKEIEVLDKPEREQKIVIYTDYIKRAYSIMADLYADKVAEIVREMEKMYGAQWILDNVFISEIADGLQKLRSPSATLFDHLYLQLVATHVKENMERIYEAARGTCITLEPIIQFIREEILTCKLPPLLFHTLEPKIENSRMLFCLNTLIIIYKMLLHVKASLTTTEYNRSPELITGNLGFHKITSLLSRFFTDTYPIDPSFFVELDQLFEQGNQDVAFCAPAKEKLPAGLTMLETQINKCINITWKVVTAERKRRAELTAATSETTTPGSNPTAFFVLPSCDPASAAAACPAALVPGL